MGELAADSPASHRLKLRLSSAAGIHLLLQSSAQQASSRDQKILHRTFQAARNFLAIRNWPSGYSPPPADSVEEETRHPTAVNRDHRAASVSSADHQTADRDNDHAAESVSGNSQARVNQGLTPDGSLHTQATADAYGSSEVEADVGVGFEGSLAATVHVGSTDSATAQIQAAETETVLDAQAAAAGRIILLTQAAGESVSGSLLVQAAAGVKIQAVYRGYRARQIFLLQKDAARLIQLRFRGRRLRKEYLLLQKDAAMKIQRWFRELRLRKEYLLQKHAAMKIQRWFRGRKLRKEYLLQRYAARLIQAHLRGFLIRRMIQRWRDAACSIQQAWRFSRAQAAPAEVTKVAEDWNSFEVDRLGDCLDTCLAESGSTAAAAADFVGLSLPERDLGRSPAKACGYQRTVREGDIQQVARVFLLQHHISVQQQRAKNAPPFPPQEQLRQQNCGMIKREMSILKSSIEPRQQQQSGDVVLDVQSLLEELKKQGYSSSSDSSSLVFMEIGACERRAIVGLKEINALLVVFFVVMIYTRSFCQGVVLWAKQSATKK